MNQLQDYYFDSYQEITGSPFEKLEIDCPNECGCIHTLKVNNSFDDSYFSIQCPRCDHTYRIVVVIKREYQISDAV